MANADVISRIARKDSDNVWREFHIGPELRYIGALPTSNNHNFEESYLLGMDTITRTWVENNVTKQVIEFRRDSDTDNYYILEIDDYTESGGSSSEGVQVDNNGAIHLKSIMSYSNNGAHQDEYNDKIVYGGEGMHFDYIPPTLVLKVYRLKYKNGANIINISTKTVTQYYETIDGVSFKFIKETITPPRS